MWNITEKRKENCVSNFLHYWGRCGGETPAERGGA